VSQGRTRSIASLVSQVALALVLAGDCLANAETGERLLPVPEGLHPAFTDESLRDPFLTPTGISGPLDGENPGDWSFPEVLENLGIEPGPDEGEADCAAIAPASPAPPRRKIPLYDNTFLATWLMPVDDFGVTDYEARTSIVVPLFVKKSPLRIAFGGGVTQISAPTAINVPNQLYNVTGELRWYIPLRETWGVDLGAGGAVFSDMEGSTGRGFRATGRAIFVKEVTPVWKLSFGILYLGRENLLAMPVAGLIYSPSEDFRVEVLVPRPRVVKRIRQNGDRGHWIYAGAEVFGGNTWAITHSTGSEDIFIYKDNRLIVGYETKAPGRLSGRVEAGYVFMREVEFENDPTTLDPGGTVMIRAGITY